MTLKEAQQEVDSWIKKYGVRYFSELTNMAVLTEEVGELARAFRDHRDLFQEEGRSRGQVAEELADVLSYLLDLSNRLGVDLESAFRAKEERNEGRTWT